jgi:2-dehydro-3-deoxyphosphooctonate aldolase (KDO 8-P synthase)
MKINHQEIGFESPLWLFAGPCVIESESLVMEIAEFLVNTTKQLKMPFVFKASFDKANRTSHASFRGPGLVEGLRILARVKETFSVPIITDVHEDTPLSEVADVVDVLQTPAFLCRQTNFMQRVAATNKPINVKKGQFLAPWDMQQVVDKMTATGNHDIMVCERGASFGYNNLISDMRSLVVMRETNCPVIFDATHSVQIPGGQGQSSGGDRQFVPSLAQAATAVGIAGVFMETHPDPDSALSDGPNSMRMADMPELLKRLQDIDQIVKSSNQ